MIFTRGEALQTIDMNQVSIIRTEVTITIFCFKANFESYVASKI